MHGPFPWARLLKWAASNAFGDEAMRVQHADLRIWVPLWFITQAHAQLNGIPGGLPGRGCGANDGSWLPCLPARPSAACSC